MAQELVYQKIESENDLRTILDVFYATTKQALENKILPKFKRLLELAKSEIIIITAIHHIKSNKGSKTVGIDGVIIQDILQKQYPAVIQAVQSALDRYTPYLLRREWIPKPGKTEKKPLGIPVLADKILRIIIEPIMEAQFFKHSYASDLCEMRIRHFKERQTSAIRQDIIG